MDLNDLTTESLEFVKRRASAILRARRTAENILASSEFRIGNKVFFYTNPILLEDHKTFGTVWGIQRTHITILSADKQTCYKVPAAKLFHCPACNEVFEPANQGRN